MVPTYTQTLLPLTAVTPSSFRSNPKDYHQVSSLLSPLVTEDKRILVYVSFRNNKYCGSPLP